MMIDMKQPIKDGVDYFDATAAIEALTQALATMVERVTQLEGCARVQLEINRKLSEQMKTLTATVADAEDDKPSLILPDYLRN